MSRRPDPFDRAARRIAAAGLLLALAACGGGGGGGGGGDDGEGRAVSGTLSVSSNLVVDGDTNDPNQARVANDRPSTAQPIAATSQVMGTANEAGSGEAGPSFAAGDESDFFRVRVAAGQTVRLDFTADTAGNDLDLYVLQRTDAGYAVVGESIGESRSECLRISEAGEYVVHVSVYAGASLYNLRVAAAGASGDCANATTPAARARVLGGQVIAGLAPASGKAAAAGALLAAQPLSLAKGRVAPGGFGLLALPADEKTRRRGLLALAGASRDALAGARGPAWMDELAETARLQLETIEYAKRLRASGAFDYVMPNRPLRATALVGAFPPDDREYPKQRWHYEQIALPTAMETLAALSPQPTRRPIVAVLDTGIVADHPDLAGQLVAGYDFIEDRDAAGDGGGRDADPDDLLSDATQPTFHGTHVAGTVAAATFNGTGVAGVAPMAQVMAIRVLGVGGEGSFYDIAQGLLYAARLDNDSGRLPARRADVANLSLGAEGAACDADTAALIARVRAQGTIVVAAAGNESERDAGQVAAVDYPANCSGVLAVTATNAQRGIAYYANGGAELALAAPGGDMRVSTTGSALPDGIYSTLASFNAVGTRIPTYGQLQGTSMATPHVAGVLALMRWANPDLTPAQVDALLQAGRLSRDLGAAGHDADYGWGVVDAAKAVVAALELKDGAEVPDIGGVVEAQPSALDFGTTTTRLEFTLRATAATDETVVSVSDDSAAVGVSPVAVDDAGLGTYRVSVDRSGLAVGVYAPTVTVRTSKRTLRIALSFEKPASAGAVDIGPIYLLVVDVRTDEVLQQAMLQASGGRYRYQVGGLDAASVYLIAGSDYDNDGTICARGEACGAWPVLGAQRTPVDLSEDRAGLDFVLSPVDVGNVGAAPATARLRR